MFWTSVAFVFSGDVQASLQVDDLVVTDSSGAAVDISAASASYDSNVAFWDLSAIDFQPDLYTFRLPSGSLTDANGNAVDGDADGVAGGDFQETRVVTFPGDANLNFEVEFADFLQLSRNFGKLDAVWTDGDFSGNGEVDFSDFLALSRNFGSIVQLPTPPPASALAPSSILALLSSHQNTNDVDNVFAEVDDWA